MLKSPCKKNYQLSIGKKIELEHAHNFPKNLQNSIAVRIAKDHIKEFPCYYSKGLVPMERKLKRLK
jgi:hypothetical protein